MIIIIFILFDIIIIIWIIIDLIIIIVILILIDLIIFIIVVMIGSSSHGGLLWIEDYTTYGKDMWQKPRRVKFDITVYAGENNSCWNLGLQAPGTLNPKPGACGLGHPKACVYCEHWRVYSEPYAMNITSQTLNPSPN